MTGGQDEVLEQISEQNRPIESDGEKTTIDKREKAMQEDVRRKLQRCSNILLVFGHFEASAYCDLAIKAIRQ